MDRSTQYGVPFERWDERFTFTTRSQDFPWEEFFDLVRYTDNADNFKFNIKNLSDENRVNLDIVNKEDNGYQNQRPADIADQLRPDEGFGDAIRNIIKSQGGEEGGRRKRRKSRRPRLNVKRRSTKRRLTRHRKTKTRGKK